MYDICAFEMPLRFLTEQISILRSWGDDVVAVTRLLVFNQVLKGELKAKK